MGRPWWEWAATHERAFAAAYDALGVLPPSGSRGPPGFVTQMVEYMQRIIDNGHGYAADGNVYFDVRSLPEYGALSGHRLEDVHQGESAGTGKRDPRDFTLWKAVKPGEPSWLLRGSGRRDGIWNARRWPPRCSVRNSISIAGWNGSHLPHHENEIAQARGAGDGFAELLAAQRLGDPGRREDVEVDRQCGLDAGDAGQGTACRTAVLPGQCPLPVDAPSIPTALAEAVAGYRRIESFLHRVAERVGEVKVGEVSAEFAEALDDDLGVPAALAVVQRGSPRQLRNSSPATALPRRRPRRCVR